MAISEDKHDMSMEEILSSIRRYVSDGNTAKTYENSEAKVKPNVTRLNDEILSTDSSAIKNRDIQDLLPKDATIEEAIVAKNNLKAAQPEQDFYPFVKQNNFTDEHNGNTTYQSPHLNSDPISNHNEYNPFNKLRDEVNSLDNSYNKPSLDLPVKDLLNQMASPLIKSWLDENLRQIVEQIVEREVQKIKQGF